MLDQLQMFDDVQLLPPAGDVLEAMAADPANLDLVGPPPVPVPSS